MVNELQIAVIEQFRPRYAPEATVLYLNTTSKFVIFEQETLERQGVPITTQNKLPDIILYDESKNWLYLIEAVPSHGPISQKRKLELEHILKDSHPKCIYITAFSTFSEYQRHCINIAWETTVWIAEVPDHTIHHNGDRFIGPHQRRQKL